MPTSAWEYTAAYLVLMSWLSNSRAKRCSTCAAMSTIKLAKEPLDCETGESRTRMRKPSGLSSM